MEKREYTRWGRVITVIVMSICCTVMVAQPILFNGATYIQDFQSMTATILTPAAITAGEMTQVSNLPGGGTCQGWYIYGMGTAPKWGRNNGLSITGSFFGMHDGQSVPDCALGSLGSPASNGYLGIVLKNTSGSTLHTIIVSYEAKINRNPGSTQNPYPMSYRTSSASVVSGVSVSDGSFNDAAGAWQSAMGYTTPATGTGSPGLQAPISPLFVIGNSPITQTLGALNWGVNEYLYIRWSETDNPGADALAGIDNIVISLPVLTQLQPGFCGYTANSFGEFIAADSVFTANFYEFKLVNSANSFTQTFINGSGYPYLALYLVPGITNNTSYTTSVRWSADNLNWSAYGNACLLSSPANVTTQLTGVCGSTIQSLSALLSAEQVSGALQYRFKLENASVGYVQVLTKNNHNFNLSLFSGLTNNITYTATVSVFINNAWDIFGPSCEITTPPPPTTDIQNGFCGNVASSYSQLIIADEVAGATLYEYQLVNSQLSYTQSITKPQNNFTLAQFTNLNNNTSYSVTVRAQVNNNWGSFANACSITTPNVPLTQISALFCGSPVPGYNSIVNADLIDGASQYEFKVMNSALNYTYTLQKQNNNCALFQFPGLLDNSTYTVVVKAFMNGSWGPFGSGCLISTPNPPLTQLESNSCGTTASSYTGQLIKAEEVAGATQYAFLLTNASLAYTASLVKSNNNFILDQFPNLINSNTYSVQVSVYFNGNWTPNGPKCEITTPSANMRTGPDQADPTGDQADDTPVFSKEVVAGRSFRALLYPNPSNSETTLLINTSDANDSFLVRIFADTGEEVGQFVTRANDNVKINGMLRSGIYNIVVSQGECVATLRMIRVL